MDYELDYSELYRITFREPSITGKIAYSNCEDDSGNNIKLVNKSIIVRKDDIIKCHNYGGGIDKCEYIGNLVEDLYV